MHSIHLFPTKHPTFCLLSLSFPSFLVLCSTHCGFPFHSYYFRLIVLFFCSFAFYFLFCNSLFRQSKYFHYVHMLFPRVPMSFHTLSTCFLLILTFVYFACHVSFSRFPVWILFHPLNLFLSFDFIPFYLPKVGHCPADCSNSYFYPPLT